MRFDGTFAAATINTIQFEKVLKNHLKIELRKVANAWLLGVVGKIPVWSGMSRGSLLELVKLINGKLVITPKGGVKSRITEGRSLGTAIENLDLNDFSITITTDVDHYNLQEYTNVDISQSAPWGSLIAGAAMAWPVLKNVRLMTPALKVKRIVI